MLLRSVIHILALLICSVYCTIPLFWLVVHFFVERWRSRGRRGFALLVPIWGGFVVVAFCSMWPFRFAQFYTNRLAWSGAAILFLLGFSLYRAALKGFHHSQLSGLDELEPDRHRQELITTGIRSRVRHPIYLGHLCEVLGWCLGTGLVPLYALALFAIITGSLMITLEDRELEARFGDQFRAYRDAVPAVIPRLSR
jgi:protein-S-isoprenylcysteine O-methyltransferase Ste14